MAIRSVATTDTLNTFRTTYNLTAGTDIGDLTTLSTSHKSSLVGAINEAFGATSSFTLRDSTSTTQAITGGDTLNVIGSNNINAVVSATDTLTVSLDNTISGITSVTASGTIAAGTMTMGGKTVATQPFAIAQAIALG
jgi:hypothetical protein